MDDIHFCTACGKQLGPGAQYCPACGATVVGTPAAVRQDHVTERESENKLRHASTLLFLGAIVTLILGVYFALQAESLVQMMIDSYNTAGVDILARLETTEAAMEEDLIQSGYLMIACGGACLIAGEFTHAAKYWTVTFVLVLIATFLGFISIFIGGILGLLVCWYVYSAKAAFKS